MPTIAQERKPLLAAGVVVSSILMLLALYFVPFVAVLIDEAVLRTYWFSANAPQWMEDVFRTVYWPLLLFFR
jgi:hypothetical protein